MQTKRIVIWQSLDSSFNSDDYQVSTSGRIRNIRTNHYLSLRPKESSGGYIYVNIRNNYNITRMYLLHVLIAKTFIDCIEGKNIVDHIDGNRINNNVNNLRWVDNKENSQNIKRKLEPKGINILQYDLKGNFIKEWARIADAAKELKVGGSAISAACNGRSKSCRGFIWKYKYDIERDPEEEWREIPDYEGYYASSLGNIKRLSGKISKGYIHNGYYATKIGKNNKRIFSHRLICLAFHGPSINDSMNVNHINGIKTDNFAANLEWVTPSDNQKHAVKIGLRCGIKVVRKDMKGEILESYDSMTDASVKSGIGRGIIKRSCEGKILDGDKFIWGYSFNG